MVLPSAPPRTTNFSLRLGEIGGNLGCRDRILGIGHHGRTGEQALNPACVSAIQSKLRKTVLRDLNGRARLGHLAAQVIDLVDSQSLVVGHNDHTGGLEHLC